MGIRKIGNLFSYKREAINDTNHDIFILTKRLRSTVCLFNLHTQKGVEVSNHIFNVFYTPLSKSVRVSRSQNQV